MPYKTQSAQPETYAERVAYNPHTPVEECACRAFGWTDEHDKQQVCVYACDNCRKRGLPQAETSK